MISMVIGRAVTGVSGFQANPSTIDPQSGEVLFAHCTIPLNMVTRYEFDTHFESGIGMGIRGHLREGDVTVFKVSGDMGRHFIEEGTLLRNQSKGDLCRTQVVLKLSDTAYFLTNPIGNHHIIPARTMQGASRSPSAIGKWSKSFSVWLISRRYSRIPRYTA